MPRLPRLLPRSPRRRAAVLGLAGLALVAGLELACRAAGYATRLALWYDPRVGFRALPHQERWTLGGRGQRVARVRVNALGLRGPLPEEPRPAGTRLVVALGDSYTFGIGVEDGETYPEHLRALLAADPGRSAVMNLSFPGWNVRNALAAYRVLARPRRPDVVLFGFTMDDMAPTEPGVRYIDNALYRFVGRSALVQALTQRVVARLPGYRIAPDPQLAERRRLWDEHDRQARRQPEDPRFRPLWDDALAALEELGREVERDGAQLVVLLLPGRDQVERLRAVDERGPPPPRLLESLDFLRARTAAAGLEALDLLPTLVALEADPMGERVTSHPSAAGYAAIAEAAAPAVRRHLAGR